MGQLEVPYSSYFPREYSEIKKQTPTSPKINLVRQDTVLTVGKKTHRDLGRRWHSFSNALFWLCPSRLLLTIATFSTPSSPSASTSPFPAPAPAKAPQPYLSSCPTFRTNPALTPSRGKPTRAAAAWRRSSIADAPCHPGPTMSITTVSDARTRFDPLLSCWLLLSRRSPPTPLPYEVPALALSPWWRLEAPCSV